jgi:hypothetical protein
VLVVVAVAPDSDLAGTLTQDLGYGLAGRVQRAEAEPSMAYTDRVERLLSCCRTFPGGPARIARGTATFKEVFVVANRAVGRAGPRDCNHGGRDCRGCGG